MRRFVVLEKKRLADGHRLIDLYDRRQRTHLYLSGPTDKLTGEFNGPITLNAGGLVEPINLVGDDSDSAPQDITGVRLRNDLIRGLLASVVQASQD